MATQQPGNSPLIYRFRMIARSEAISYLVLLGIAMPLKYAAGISEAVIAVGWAHGLLFIAYMVMLAMIQLKYKWPFKKFFLAGCASIVPFGPFVFDKKFLSELSAPEIASQE